MKATRRLYLTAVAVSGFAAILEGVTYSDDLSDILARNWLAGHSAVGSHKPNPIGDLGPIQTVVDLRGFVPMSFASASASSVANQAKRAMEDPRTLIERIDMLQWYKIPTTKGLLLLYYGGIDSTQLASNANTDRWFHQTRFVKESDVTGETAAWCKLAYGLAHDSEPLFRQIAGDAVFEGAEPVNVFFTDQSSFVMLSFRYSNTLRKNTGQLLVAMEFSRRQKNYKTFYLLYSTMIVDKPTGDAFKASAPYVAKAIRFYFTGF